MLIDFLKSLNPYDKKIKVNHYNILDKDGNVVGQLQGNEGSIYYNEGQNAADTGGVFRVFETEREDDEKYAPISQARADIEINPVAGKITVTGPDWLTNEIVNSESFKQNITENNALKTLVKEYQKDPAAAIPLKDGGEMWIGEAIGKYQSEVNDLFSDYAKRIVAKNGIKDRYGVELNDEELAIAYSGQRRDSEDYDKNGAVPIPNYAMKMFDWRSLASWNEETRTVSADDFYKNVYNFDFFDKEGNELARKLRDRSEMFMKDALAKNAYDRSNPEIDEIRQNEFASDEYKDELARARAFYVYMTQNTPDASGAMQTALWASGFCKEFTMNVANAGINIGTGVMQFLEGLTSVFGNVEANPVLEASLMVNPAYISAALLGSVGLAMESGVSADGLMKDMGETLSEFVNVSDSKFGSEAFASRSKEYKEILDANDLRMGGGIEKSKILGETVELEGLGGDAFNNGEFFGHMAYKVVENILLLNTVGGIAKSLVDAYTAEGVLIETAPAIARFIAKFMPTAACKVLGFVANIGVQGVLETFIDDKEFVDQAFAEGRLTEELMDKIENNILWNAIGEASPFVGSGIKSAIVSTTPGKALDMALSKAGAAAALPKAMAGKKVFSWLNKFKVADSAGGIAVAGGKKSVSQYMTEYYDAQIKARKALLNLPIFKGATEEQKAIIKDSASFILTGKDYRTLMNAKPEDVDQATKDLIADMFKKADELSSGVKQNYAYFQKAMLNRINLENNFDSILRGDKAKLEQMNAYAGVEKDAYTASLTKTLEMEQRAIKGGAGLTARETGSLMTQQSSEYMSMYVQKGRVEAGIASGKLSGQKLEAATEYNAFLERRMGELRRVLGDDLVSQLESHTVVAGRYYRKLQNYMRRNGYLSNEALSKLDEFRADDAGWGAGGERYVPTARLFAKNDFQTNIDALMKDLETGQIIKGKTLADDFKSYKYGDEADSFMDPNMVLYAHARMMAKAAQGQDMWRALRANNLLARSIKGFDSDGFTEFEVDLAQRGCKQMAKEFKAIFERGGDEILNKTVREAFDTNRVFSEGYKSIFAEREYGRVSSEIDAKLSVGNYKSTLLSDAPESDMDAILAFAPGDAVVPNFSAEGVSQATFKEWRESLPDSVRNTLKESLGGRRMTYGNVKKLFSENPDNIAKMKRAYLVSEDAVKVWDTTQAKDYLRRRAFDDARAFGSIVVKEDADAYAEAVSRITGKKFDIEDESTFSTDFAMRLKGATSDITDKMIDQLKANDGTARNLNEIVSRLTSTGVVDAKKAEQYAALWQLSKMDKKTIGKMLKGNDGSHKNIAKDAAKKMGIDVKASSKEVNQVADILADGIQKQFSSQFNIIQNQVKMSGAGDLMDLDTYWNTIEEAQRDIYKEYGKWLKSGDETVIERHFVRAVDENGDLRYYATDPSTAFLVNQRPNYNYDSATRFGDVAKTLNSNINQIFRWGTTGIDRISFMNQWFRDFQNAVGVAGAKPFTDLTTGGTLARSAASDYIPFGQKLFGKHITERVSEEVVNETYAATRKGLAAEYGSDFVSNLEENAAKGLTGEAATAAKKRAVVEYNIQRSGYEALPSGGMREVETYRVTTGSGTGKAKTQVQVRQEEFDSRMKFDKNAFDNAASKMQRAIDDFFTNTSKGGWRETFLRKSVFTSQYNMAIKSGMSAPEAKMWATRYAMDATTNFGRPFPIGNNWARNVPFLGAAFNGSKSFYRLLEIDPVGVSSRITFGLILPYTATLAESLSDPQNLAAYMKLPEYEKNDKLVFFYKGSKVTIPIPQELSGFFSPFRHMVEKAAGANDESWVNLITSDALGMLPLDMSGFVENIDANTLLADDQNTGLWTHIRRGTEKMASSLMPPLVKSMYMAVSGKDPYTGRQINNSYTTLDDEGNPVIMDSNQSEIAQLLSDSALGKSAGLSASGAYEVLKNLMGRSTLAVLDGAVEVFTGAVDDGEYKKQTAKEWLEGRLNEAGEQFMKPISGTKQYNMAASDWQRAINSLYDMRDKLITDDAFTAAFRTLQSEGASEEKKKGAMQTYKSILDNYEQKVVEATIALKAKYPKSYTTTRQAQIVSLLTLPTGLTYNETAYAQKLRNEEYYDAKAQALATFVQLGFPEDVAGETILGRGYYDSNGHYKFKVYTPYEIQYIQDATFGRSSEFQAQVDQIMAENNISESDKWKAYYSASTKSERKKIMEEWNMNVIPKLAPIIQKYGIDMVLGNGKTRDKLTEYIYTSNPYKEKEYLYKVFGEND